jgi:hypothetical protein
MASVAFTDRIHERTRPLSKVLLKSLASAGPSIHEALDEGILHGLARRDIVPCDTALIGQVRMALLVSSLPLSLTTIFGLPRSITSRSSSRATRLLESEVSATSARHSRVQSSTHG